MCREPGAQIQAVDRRTGCTGRSACARASVVGMAQLRLDQTLDQFEARFDRAEEGNPAAMLDQQCRKILDIDIAHQIGFIFNVDPDELHVRVQIGKGAETVAKIAADIAPGGAQACHAPGIVAQGGMQMIAIVGGKGQNGHRRIVPSAENNPPLPRTADIEVIR